MLGVHDMIRYCILLYRTEGAETDVQQHRCDTDSLITNAVKQLLSKVQARRRCGSRALAVGIDRLIASRIRSA